jgi:antitoxin (DNA-binding transcriptional repressor) of toxin-antitoxin stability system
VPVVKCLSIIDEVGETGESVVISKHGRPVARLIKYVDLEGEYPQRQLLGSVVAAGDLTSPVIPADAWESACE